MTLNRCFMLRGTGIRPFVLLLLSCLTLIPFTSQAQRTCGTQEYTDNMLKSNPNIRYRMRLVEDQTQENVKSSAARVNGDVVIPVVVHVVYQTTEQNISDAQIKSQIKVLNEDFQRKNSDRDQTPAIFQSVAANTGIRFQLATRDPNGNSTTGITRKKTYKASFYTNDNDVKYSAMGGVDPWPTDQYLNIWVCNLGLGILGYSQFPGGPKETDGVVIGYKFFGTIGDLKAPFNLGRTTTHEVGHWLNLRHIWGDGPCGVDDHVADTPAADAPSSGCYFGRKSCGSVNMTQNFMDYTDDACMNLFTKGQAQRMRALFAEGGHRHSLMESKGIPRNTPPKPEPQVTVLEFPDEVNIADVSKNSAFFSWNEVSSASQYMARMRRKGSNKWSPRKFQKTYVNATGLRSCTEYEFQLASISGSKSSSYSPSYIFKTEGCGSEAPIALQAPRSLKSQQIGSNQVKISWARVSGAVSYKVQYKIAGIKGIRSQLVSSNHMNIPKLRPGYRYIYRVRAHYA
ncbi:MAG: M43 family zinc metalloprotease, partial [Bacteroidota bacterium]